jgi:5'-3' exonuclease
MICSATYRRHILQVATFVRHESTSFALAKPPLLVVDGTAAIVSANRAIRHELATSKGVVTTAAFGLLSTVIKLKRRYPTNPMLVVLERAMDALPSTPLAVGQLSNSDFGHQSGLACSPMSEPLVTTMVQFDVANHAHPLPIFYRNRAEAYPAYKAHRRNVNTEHVKTAKFAKTPLQLLTANSMAANLIGLTATPLLPLPAGIEADDAIASICAWRDLNKQGR